MAVLRAGVEPVHRVDHAGDSARSGGKPAVEARFRIMGVHDVRSEVPEQPAQLQEGQDVLAGGDRTRGVLQRHMTDAPGFEFRDVGPRGRDTDDFHPRVGERSELPAEQQHQAHVDRGDVNQFLPDQSAQRAPAACS